MTDPAPHSVNATYYTDDALAMPYRVWWRVCLSFNLGIGPALFAFFALRKLLGWRFAPEYGMLPWDQSPLVAFEEVPSDVQAHVQPYLNDAAAAGLVPVAVARPVIVGKKRQFEFLLLEPQGPSFATLTWFRQESAGSINTVITFGCTSFLAGERELHTVTQLTKPEVSFDAEALAAAMFPPWIEWQWLPMETPASTIAAVHRQRVAARSDVVPLDLGNPLPQLKAATRRTFEYLVQRRLVVPLTESQVRQLISASAEPIVQAELAR